MGLLDRWRNRNVDTSWVDRQSSPIVADRNFEDWLAQPGTDFLPPYMDNTPLAQISPTLSAAMADGSNRGYSGIYRTQYAVYTVVEFLAWQLSQIGIKAYNRISDTDREELSGHPLTKLLNYPAPGLTYSRFIHGIVADMSIFGNAYVLMLEPPMGSGYTLAPISPINVEVRGGNVIEAAEYKVTIQGNTKVYPADQVLHFRHYNPIDGRVGVSPLEPLRAILNEEYESSRYRKQLWARDARMGGFLQRPKDSIPMDDEARKQFRAGLDKFTKGGNREGSWMLLEEGEVPFAIAFSPHDSEFIEGRKFSLEAVCRAFHIPVAVLGLSETATYASQREFHSALYRDTLPPYTRMMEDEFECKLIPWVTGTPEYNSKIYLEFTLSEKLRGSFEEQGALLQAAVGGPYMTRNEARARLNLPRVDDPQADELVITNNMTGTESNQPEPPMAPVVQIAPPAQPALPPAAQPKQGAGT